MQRNVPQEIFGSKEFWDFLESANSDAELAMKSQMKSLHRHVRFRSSKGVIDRVIVGSRIYSYSFWGLNSYQEPFSVRTSVTSSWFSHGFNPG